MAQRDKEAGKFETMNTLLKETEDDKLKMDKDAKVIRIEWKKFNRRSTFFNSFHFLSHLPPLNSILAPSYMSASLSSSLSMRRRTTQLKNKNKTATVRSSTTNFTTVYKETLVFLYFLSVSASSCIPSTSLGNYEQEFRILPDWRARVKVYSIPYKKNRGLLNFWY